MGQMTHRPSVWCRKHYFFHNFFRLRALKTFQFYFCKLKKKKKILWTLTHLVNESLVPAILLIILKIDGFLMLVRQQTVPPEGQRPGILMGAPCPLPVKRSIKAKEIKSSRPIPNRVTKISTNGWWRMLVRWQLKNPKLCENCICGTVLMIQLKSIHWVDSSTRSPFFEKGIISPNLSNQARADFGCHSLNI